MYLFVCLFVCLFGWLVVCLFVCLFGCLFICLLCFYSFIYSVIYSLIDLFIGTSFFNLSMKGPEESLSPHLNHLHMQELVYKTRQTREMHQTCYRSKIIASQKTASQSHHRMRLYRVYEKDNAASARWHSALAPHSTAVDDSTGR